MCILYFILVFVFINQKYKGLFDKISVYVALTEKKMYSHKNE